MTTTPPPDYAGQLRDAGLTVHLDEPLARYSVARLGGNADALVQVDSAAALESAARVAWREGWPLRILGGGANVLIADSGFRGLIVINQAKAITFEDAGHVHAESGAGLIGLARDCMARGWAGLEWAIGVPGTLGGAVINNAGAHGGDMAASLVWAEIAQPDREAERWTLAQMDYAYRESALKRFPPGERRFAVLRACLRLNPGTEPASLLARAEAFNARRKASQPPGASLGSMFKNPPGDYAGRLIEAAGLKGAHIGGVIISPVHANFFVNTGGGTASDYIALIRLAQETVFVRFGIHLELEIEIVGDTAT